MAHRRGGRGRGGGGVPRLARQAWPGAAGASALDDLSLHWLQPAFANPIPVYCLGAALTVWLLGGIVERAAGPALALARRRRAPAPADFLALVALILFVGTYAVSAGFLDRYWLPIVPFLIAGGLAGLRGAGWRRPARGWRRCWRWPATGSRRTWIDYNALRAEWAAGRWVVAQGVATEHLRNGTPWDGYYLFDEALRRLSSHDIAVIGRAFPPDQIITPDYVIDTTLAPGYRVVARFPYFSPLARAEQVWLVQRR